MKDPHAVALGQRAGQRRTPAKARASRENGRRGGRPNTERKIRAAFDDLDADSQLRVVAILREVGASYLLMIIGRSEEP